MEDERLKTLKAESPEKYAADRRSAAEKIKISKATDDQLKAMGTNHYQWNEEAKAKKSQLLKDAEDALNEERDKKLKEQGASDGNDRDQKISAAAPGKDGSRSYRNKNPGNIKGGGFAKSMGSIGNDADGFAIFKSVEDGRKAQEKLLFESSGYKDLTLKEAIAKWVPKKDKNDPDAYAERMLKKVGGKELKMGEYSADERKVLMAQQTQEEGYFPGKDSGKSPDKSKVAQAGAASGIGAADADSIKIGDHERQGRDAVAKIPEQEIRPGGGDTKNINLTTTSIINYPDGKQAASPVVFKKQVALGSAAPAGTMGPS
jgi:hypothetical protein